MVHDPVPPLNPEPSEPSGSGDIRPPAEPRGPARRQIAERGRRATDAEWPYLVAIIRWRQNATSGPRRWAGATVARARRRAGATVARARRHVADAETQQQATNTDAETQRRGRGAVARARRRARGAVEWLQAPPEALRRGPLRADAFPSRLRSARLTSQLGIGLAAAFGICFATGLLSHLIQHPPEWFWWPSRPVGLYRFTQGLHVATGLATVPLLGAKLWSVYPRLFAWPPLAGAIERLSIAALVGASLFQLVSGILNTARWYAPMPFFFTAAHYRVAWLAIGALVTHVGVKLPVIRDALRGPAAEGVKLTQTAPAAAPPAAPATTRTRPRPRPAAAPRQPRLRSAGALRGLIRRDLTRREVTQHEPTPREPTQRELTQREPTPHEPTPHEPTPHEPTRRGLLGAVGVAAGVITVATIGETVAPLAPVSLLAPRRPTNGPQRVPVNKTAVAAGVRDSALSPAYRMQIVGPARRAVLAIADLTALPQHTVVLPIACVEGWSSTGTWSGVRLRDLAALVGVDPDAAEAQVESLEAAGRYRVSTVATPHLRDPRTLIALRLGGEPLALDHGYPARLIAPNRPGVLQTKWVTRITLRPAP